MNYFENIINSLDYEAFLGIIHNSPSCIFFKDTQLRYVFCTKHWEQQNSKDVIGKTDLEIRKDKENAILAMEADKNIIKTGLYNIQTAYYAVIRKDEPKDSDARK